MAQVDKSMSLANPHPHHMDWIQKVAAAIGGIGLLILFVAIFGVINNNYPLWLASALGLMTVGTLIYSWREYAGKPAGIKNNHVWFRSLTNIGLWGWIAGILITGFYILLYFFPGLFGYQAFSVNTSIPHGSDPAQITIRVENQQGQVYSTNTLSINDTIKTGDQFDEYKFTPSKIAHGSNRIIVGCKTGDDLYSFTYNKRTAEKIGDTNPCQIEQAELKSNSKLISLFDPLSMALKGKPASQWFLYGVLYTLAILVFGFKFILKYWHNRYQLVRTISVMFFQLGFAFLIPELLEGLNRDRPYFTLDMKNMWPLNAYFFQDWNLNGMLAGGKLGMFMLFLGIAMIFIISPLLTYFYGKRWYCSWVCGCGGLAETAGDPFRHLSDKSLKAWKIERWLIHVVLVLITIVTVAVLFSYFRNDPEGKLWINPTSFTMIVILLAGLVSSILYFNRKEILGNVSRKVYNGIHITMGVIAILSVIAWFTGSWNVFFIDSYQLRKWYGFLIGNIFSGVIGVGFYPLMGSRVWCRFGCPMAALLGLQQRFFSRFRITTNGGQCISCGNCSTYCEMGIDVRAYAQKGQNVVRASCVGCGICAAVCPRGVLRLENGSVDIKERTTDMRTIHITADEVGILS